MHSFKTFSSVIAVHCFPLRFKFKCLKVSKDLMHAFGRLNFQN